MSDTNETDSSFVELTPEQFDDCAPRLAVEALESGWTEVSYFPEGYLVPSPCGCCRTRFRYPAGWYGMRPGVAKEKAWEWICSPTGEFVYWNLGAINPQCVSH
jgi:hypothetical protein